MLPIIDYGSIAIVIPHVMAVGNLLESEEQTGFEVFLTGLSSPLIIGFESMEEAEDAREDLIEMVAEYQIMKMMGPDFDITDLADDIDENRNEH